jgi:hypothetical protein
MKFPRDLDTNGPPMRLRISIRRLITSIGLCGVGFAALAEPTKLWATVLFVLALIAFAVAALAAVFTHGPNRINLTVFAFFGSAYLVLAFGPWFREEVRPHLPTTWIIEKLPQKHLEILKCPEDLESIPGPGNLTYSVSGFQRWNAVPFVTSPNLDVSIREQIGHSLFAFIFAFMASSIARFTFPGFRSSPNPRS